MPIRIRAIPADDPQVLIVPGASYDQSQWLGARGWWFYGRMTKPDIARRLSALGVPANTRWLPVRNAAVASQVVGEPGVELDEAAERILAPKARQQAASREAEGTLEIPAPEGLAYRPYQRAGVSFALDAFTRGQKGVIFGDEMGLGKTMQAIGTIVLASPERVLVVCPASLRENWRRELEKWVPALRGGDMVALAEEGHLPPARVVIINYDKVAGPSRAAKSYRAELAKAEWDLVVFDEAHMLKNEGAERTKVFFGEHNFKKGGLVKQGVVHRSKRVLLLTGTPIQNKVRETIPLLRAIEAFGPGKVADYEGAFLFKYCGPKSVWVRGEEKRTFDGATNLPDLQARLRAGWMVRRLKAQVATELPPKLRSVVRMPLPPEWVEKLTEDCSAPEGDLVTAPTAEAFSEAVYKLVGETVGFDAISAYRADLAHAKADGVVEYLEELLEDPDQKVIVFGHHQSLLDAIQKKFPVMSIRIDGGVAPALRQGLVDRFQTDPGVRLAILSTHAAGVGLTLTAASMVVFAEADWNPSWCVQAEDRAHRIGQEADSVTVHYLVLDRTLDARVVTTMAAKMDIADRALDRRAAAVALPADKLPEAPKPAPAPVRSRVVTIKARDEEITEELSDDRVRAVAEGLLLLAGQCDGARTRDDCGFNGRDASSDFVQSLVAASAGGRLSDRQAAWGLKVLRTYRHTQLPEDLVARLWPEDAS